MKTLENKEAYDLVVGCFEEIKKIIEEKLKEINPGQRFVIKSRIINLLFSHHYNISIKFANEQLKKGVSNDT